MKVIVPKSPSPRELILPDGPVVVNGGDTVDVPDDVGANLVEQGWKKSGRKKDGDD